jgi:hypothetical protein
MLNLRDGCGDARSPAPGDAETDDHPPLHGDFLRKSYWLWLRVALVVVAVAHRRLAPSSSATTSTTERAPPSSAVQARSWSRPTTTRLPPLMTNPRRQDRLKHANRSALRVF